MPMTLEDTLQRFQESQVGNDDGVGQSIDQIQTQVISTSAIVSVRPTWVALAQPVKPFGFVIGHPDRARINGSTTLPKAITTQVNRIRMCKGKATPIGRG